ncbi:MAG: hypothetical protein AB1Z98_06430 [Nannocystaceae bacterium]
MSSWRSRAPALARLPLPLGLLLGLTACPVRYPQFTDAGPAVVPPSRSTAPLEEGRPVKLVMGTPPGCRSLGLATGVSGVPGDQEYVYESVSGDRYPALRAQALVALRNEVGKAGGTHTRIDVEVRYTTSYGLTNVILRGPALVCG